jgi:hypothetical protein
MMTPLPMILSSFLSLLGDILFLKFQRWFDEAITREFLRMRDSVIVLYGLMEDI